MSSHVSQNERCCADKVLNDLKGLEGAWRIVDTILQQSGDVNTKFFALQILEDTIQTRWKMFTSEEQGRIRNYIINLIVKLTGRELLKATDEVCASSQAAFLTKLNKTLIQIVKQEWPDGWPNFINEICGAAKTTQFLCENNLKILLLLSEDIFDFGRETMVSKKVLKLKYSMTTQFASIFELCMFIFQNHINTPGTVYPSLLKTNLNTLAQFLSWIPVGYIFETKLIEILIHHFWDPPIFRVECCKCLHEIACLHEGVENYKPQIVRCFEMVVMKIKQLPEDVPVNIQSLAQNQLFWDSFLNQLALLLSVFIRNNMGALMANPQLVVPALRYLGRITVGAPDSTFKICLEFWHLFAARLYVDKAAQQEGQSPPFLDITISGQKASVPSIQCPQLGNRDEAYGKILSDVRGVLIDRMAKPPEVTITETEEGTIERVEEEDTDEVALYNSMREALIYLTHLDSIDMQNLMLRRLTQFVSEEPGSVAQLNRVCWAIGSISGGLNETEEKAFVVQVIRDLLTLCEQRRGKDNKACVASNIMYVVGQYPRFLKQHWKFLRTVILKLMEFMQETFPGVQEMACDTFLKIVGKCKKMFSVVHTDEKGMFVEEMIAQIRQDTIGLAPLHVCTFFETIGVMISAAPNEQKEVLIENLMANHNARWAQVLAFANADSASLRDLKVISEVSIILRINERVASAVGFAFSRQLSHIYVDMLTVYRVYSETISQGGVALGVQYIKQMRIVKRDVLQLVHTFVEKSAMLIQQGCFGSKEQARQELAQRFLPPLLGPVLADYRSNVPQARDAEVLDLIAAFACALPAEISCELNRIFEMVFECTLEMIKTDFQSFPDHRVKLYDMLKGFNSTCFGAVLRLPETQLRLYVDSLIWAVRHEHIAVSDSGLKIAHSFLQKVTAEPLAHDFFRAYYIQLLSVILGVLTDTLHKPGVKMQVQILQQLIVLCKNNVLDVTPKQVMETAFNLLSSSFKNLTTSIVQEFIVALFESCARDKDFFLCISDFLITLESRMG